MKHIWICFYKYYINKILQSRLKHFCNNNWDYRDDIIKAYSRQSKNISGLVIIISLRFI